MADAASKGQRVQGVIRVIIGFDTRRAFWRDRDVPTDDSEFGEQRVGAAGKIRSTRRRPPNF